MHAKCVVPTRELHIKHSIPIHSGIKMGPIFIVAPKNIQNVPLGNLWGDRLMLQKGGPIRSCLNPSLRRLHYSGYMKKIAISYLRASFSIVTAGPLVLWTLSMGQKKANIRIYGRSALYFCSLFNNDSENGLFDFHSWSLGIQGAYMQSFVANEEVLSCGLGLVVK